MPDLLLYGYGALLGLYLAACITLAGFAGGVRAVAPAGSAAGQLARDLLSRATLLAFLPMAPVAVAAGITGIWRPLLLAVLVSPLGVPGGPLLFWWAQRRKRGASGQ